MLFSQYIVLENFHCFKQKPWPLTGSFLLLPYLKSLATAKLLFYLYRLVCLEYSQKLYLKIYGF